MLVARGQSFDHGGLLTTIVYTDGACSGNPGPGGWAWVVPEGPWAAGHAHHTTNQRMEITAALQAVLAIPGPLEVRSDSSYVVNCFRDGWWRGWLARGWRNSQRKPVANRDLWEPLIEAVRERGDVRFTWVKGHSNDRWNDIADRLAVLAMHRQEDLAGDRPPGDPGDIGPPDSVENEADGDSELEGTDVVEPAAAEPAGGEPAAGGTPVIGDTRSAVQRTTDGSPGLPEHSVVVVGQRQVPAEAVDDVRGRLERHLTGRAEEQPDLVVVTGLRQGAEQLGAEASVGAGLPYLVVLPYPEPDQDWPSEERAHFAQLLSGASEIRLLDERRPRNPQGATAALKRRDAWLADHAREALVIWDGSESRTANLYQTLVDRLGDDVLAIDPGPVTAPPRRPRPTRGLQ
jgi:ribonuclease HI/uncharacterized phage-like protein YoqJ